MWCEICSCKGYYCSCEIYRLSQFSSSFIFGKTVHILEQINVRRQITVHIFAPDGYCLYLRGMWLFWVQNRRLNQKLISENK